MNAETLIGLMRTGGSLTCLGEYAIELPEYVLEVSPSAVNSAIKSGMVACVCDNGSPILKFQLTGRGRGRLI